jgi:hypothetical protein
MSEGIYMRDYYAEERALRTEIHELAKLYGLEQWLKDFIFRHWLRRSIGWLSVDTLRWILSELEDMTER